MPPATASRRGARSAWAFARRNRSSGVVAVKPPEPASSARRARARRPTAASSCHARSPASGSGALQAWLRDTLATAPSASSPAASPPSRSVGLRAVCGPPRSPARVVRPIALGFVTMARPTTAKRARGAPSRRGGRGPPTWSTSQRRGVHAPRGSRPASSRTAGRTGVTAASRTVRRSSTVGTCSTPRVTAPAPIARSAARASPSVRAPAPPSQLSTTACRAGGVAARTRPAAWSPATVPAADSAPAAPTASATAAATAIQREGATRARRSPSAAPAPRPRSALTRPRGRSPLARPPRPRRRRA